MIGRNNAGRFTQGNSFGLGRPKRKTEEVYVQALSEACSVESWKRIVNRAVQDAEGGDAKARDFIARYLIGTPISRSQPEPEEIDVPKSVEEMTDEELCLRIGEVAVLIAGADDKCLEEFTQILLSKEAAQRELAQQGLSLEDQREPSPTDTPTT